MRHHGRVRGREAFDGDVLPVDVKSTQSMNTYPSWDTRVLLVLMKIPRLQDEGFDCNEIMSDSTDKRPQSDVIYKKKKSKNQEKYEKSFSTFESAGICVPLALIKETGMPSPVLLCQNIHSASRRFIMGGFRCLMNRFVVLDSSVPITGFITFRGIRFWGG